MPESLNKNIVVISYGFKRYLFIRYKKQISIINLVALNIIGKYFIHSNHTDLFVSVFCQAAGKYRQQGRNYVVDDGDIIFFKFNAGAGLKDQKKK